MRAIGVFLLFSYSVTSLFFGLIVKDFDPSSLLGKVADYSVSFDNKFYDFRMKRHLDPKFMSKDITIINIDDYSLQKIGSWPLPRTIHAQMIRKLNHFGAKVIGLDIIFPEKSPVCGVSSPDKDFAKAIEEFQSSGNRIYMAYTMTDNFEDAYPEAPLEIFDDIVDSQSSSSANMSEMRVSRYTFPTKALLESKVGLGYINNNNDSDGIFRHYPLVANNETIYYGSLAYNVYNAFVAQKPKVRISNDGTGIASVNGKEMEMNNRGEVKIRYKGGAENFSSVSLFDLINAKNDDPIIRKKIQDKMIFVGSTALGAHDLRPTPLDSKMPGVYAHANIAEMLNDQYFYQKSEDSVRYSLIILLVVMILVLLFQRLGNPILDVLGIVSTILGIHFLDEYYFLPKGYELKLFYCYFCFIATYSWITFVNFMEANREKKQIKGTFARYVAPTIVDEMLKDPDKLHVGGFKRDITCLFSDVRDFTSISEGLSAAELAHSLNMYMGKMTDIVFDTKGTLDKYIGDAIVAFWGAPLEIGNHAQFAVEGAIKMMEKLPEINAEFRKLGRPEFKVGIGLNSGECNVGNMGSDRIFSYTALGDNMNLGARLEGLCKYYGTNILISEYTLARIDQEKIKIRPIDKVIVKGKTTPVSIYEVLHKWHPLTLDPEAHSFYMAAWNMFHKKQFSGAAEICDQILVGIENDVPTKRLRDLCKKYVNDASLVHDDFDITKMTEK
jgi:adenylate cyclase